MLKYLWYFMVRRTLQTLEIHILPNKHHLLVELATACLLHSHRGEQTWQFFGSLACVCFPQKHTCCSLFGWSGNWEGWTWGPSLSTWNGKLCVWGQNAGSSLRDVPQQSWASLFLCSGSVLIRELQGDLCTRPSQCFVQKLYPRSLPSLFFSCRCVLYCTAGCIIVV